MKVLIMPVSGLKRSWLPILKELILFSSPKHKPLYFFMVVFVTACTGLDSNADSIRNIIFEDAIYLESHAGRTAGVSIGDVNGDGHLDIVFANGRHWQERNELLLGDGEGNFNSTNTLFSEALHKSYGVVLSDLNVDGHLDVVVSNDKKDSKQIFFNNRIGDFKKPIDFGKSNWHSRYVAVADLNADKLPDIIVANRKKAGGENYYCLNAGVEKKFGDCVEFSSVSSTLISPADINNDGQIDLVVPNRDGGQSYVYMNRGGEFKLKIPFGPSDASFRLAKVGDFNGDGTVDIVTIDDRKRKVSIFYGFDDGFSKAEDIFVGEITPYALSVADLDKNGLEDIIVGFKKAPLAVFFQGASGLNVEPYTFGDGDGIVYALESGDFNEDGITDIVTAVSGGRNVIYFGTLKGSQVTLEK